MKVKVTQPLLDYEKKEIPTEDGTNLILRIAIVNALNYTDPAEPQLAEEKAKIYAISTKVYSKSEVEFTVDELAFIKEKASKALTPLAYGRLLEVIDPTED